MYPEGYAGRKYASLNKSSFVNFVVWLRRVSKIWVHNSPSVRPLRSSQHHKQLICRGERSKVVVVEKRPICLAQICPAWLVSFIVDRRGPLEWRPREKAHSSTDAAAHPRAHGQQVKFVNGPIDIKRAPCNIQSRAEGDAVPRAALIISTARALHGPVRSAFCSVPHTPPPASMPFLFFFLSAAFIF